MEDKIVGKKIKAVPVEDPNIGVDLDDTFQEDIFDAIEISSLDTSALQNFSNVAQTREQMYTAVDIMRQDNKVSAIIETYTDYVTQTNDNGKVMWCESDDPDIGNYVSFLLEELEVDKHMYSWAYNLFTYGDLYLQTYTKSEYEEDLFSKFKEDQDIVAKGQQLNESQLKENVYINIEDKNDHLEHYVEAVANPGEMFELTKFGKTMSYIKAPTDIQTTYDSNDALNYYMTYKMQDKDVEVYSPLKFVHIYLSNGTSRNPEQVNIFTNDDDFENDKVKASYTVRRGQSMLYNKFRSWRELTLLENSMLLNRVTKSAILRIISAEVKNMPKDQVKNHMQKLKTMIEQKSALNADKSFSEYTNPGPIENIIYTTTRDGEGTLNVTTLGGDPDVKSLADIEYFENDFYGGFGIPKQYFGRTNDSTGFNGGTSLSIISSKFGTNVKTIQNALIQGLTTLINIFLLDKGLTSYVNNFRLRMQPPITQEEKDKQEAQRDRVGVIQDTGNLINDVVTDELIKAKIVKQLLSTTNIGSEVLDLMQEQIDKLEKEQTPETDEEVDNEENEKPSRPGRRNEPSFSETDLPDIDLEPEEEETGFENEETAGPVEPSENETTLPSPNDLGIDMTNSENI